ncbi:SGNH/GDSL hydrolase family protein [Burkholderia ambifaria]|uniref:SGNH/GDSL hydrolase family protein n=1 Tax=Burkholderia ambifaria TaxID=152480 RepID=UPI001588FBE6|nr:SGNH/GDSL hydrolase family protein [Burkholderia ambifaria]
MLSACGGGGGGDAPASTPVPPPAKKAVLIDAEGDSTMYGWSMTSPDQMTPVAQPAPTIMQAELAQSIGGQITVVNNGIGGTTAPESVTGLAPFAAPLATRLASIRPNIVIVNYGINDAGRETTDDYQQALVGIVAAIRGAGAVPVLEEPNPVCRGPGPLLDAYVGVMRTVAQQYGVHLIQQYDYIKSLPNWQSMMPDCVHPNQDLYRIKGDREAQQLRPLIQSLQ